MCPLVLIELISVVAIVGGLAAVVGSYMYFINGKNRNTEIANQVIYDSDLFHRYLEGNYNTYALLPNQSVSYISLSMLQQQGYINANSFKEYKALKLIPCAMVITKYVQYSTGGDAGTTSLTKPTLDTILFYVKTQKSTNMPNLRTSDNNEIAGLVGGAGGIYKGTGIIGNSNGWSLSSFTPDPTQCQDLSGNQGVSILQQSPVVNIGMMFPIKTSPFRNLSVGGVQDELGSGDSNTINADIMLQRSPTGAMPALLFENQSNKNFSKNQVSSLSGLSLGLSFGQTSGGQPILNIRGSNTQSTDVANGTSFQSVNNITNKNTFIGSGVGGIAASHFIFTEQHIINERCNNVGDIADEKQDADGNPYTYSSSGALVLLSPANGLPANHSLVECQDNPLCTMGSPCWRARKVSTITYNFSSLTAFNFVAPPGFFITDVKYSNTACTNSNVRCDSAQCEKVIEWSHGDNRYAHGANSCYRKTSIGPWGELSDVIVNGEWLSLNKWGFYDPGIPPKNGIFYQPKEIQDLTYNDSQLSTQSLIYDKRYHFYPVATKLFYSLWQSRFWVDKGYGDGSCDPWKGNKVGRELAYIYQITVTDDLSLPLAQPIDPRVSSYYHGNLCM